MIWADEYGVDVVLGEGFITHRRFLLTAGTFFKPQLFHRKNDISKAKGSLFLAKNRAHVLNFG